MSQPVYALGIDVGSTTVKTVVIDDNKQILSSCYQRHLSRVRETVAEQIHNRKESWESFTFRLYPRT